MWSYNYAYSPNELYHHGIKGQRWGVRRYQNKDGSLTLAGKSKQKTRSQQIKEARANKSKYLEEYQTAKAKYYSTPSNSKHFKEVQKVYRESEKRYLDTISLAQKETGREVASKAIGTIGGLLLASLVAGGYTYVKYRR